MNFKEHFPLKTKKKQYQPSIKMERALTKPDI